MKPDELIAQGRMLTTQQLRRMWPVSRQTIWRACNSKSESDRLPSYRMPGIRVRLFRYDELVYYMDKHKTMPKETTKTKGKKHHETQ